MFFKCRGPKQKMGSCSGASAIALAPFSFLLRASRKKFALRAQADRMSALHQSPVTPGRAYNECALMTMPVITRGES